MSKKPASPTDGATDGVTLTATVPMLIADVLGRSFEPSAGFRASFLTCAAIVGAGVLLALTLPWWPQPDHVKETT